jgi:hypothetical protein
MRAIRPLKPRKEWRGQSGQPPAKDHSALLDNPWLQNITVGLLVLVLGFFAQNVNVGLILTGLYGASALLLRLPSDVTL